MLKRTQSLLLLLFLLCHFVNAQDYSLIKEKLDSIFIRSTQLRQQIPNFFMKYGEHSKEADSLNQVIKNFDAESLITVTEILEKHGWLSKRNIGEMANIALFLTIQHAPDSETRQKYFPLLKASAEDGESDLSDMATMQDRILVESGEKQLYGTQSHYVEDELRLFPVENPEKLNKRRRKVGLPKIKD